MKKTWTTRILIALMTLAMVVGVIAIAPKEAQASVSVTSNGGSLTQEVTENSSIADVSFEASSSSGYTSPNYSWNQTNGSLPSGVTLENDDQKMCYITGTPDTPGVYKVTLRATVSDTASSQSEVGYSKVITIKVNPTPVPMGVTAPSAAAVTAKVSENISDCVFDLTGEPMPDKVTVDGLGSDLGYSYNKSAKTVTITGKPATANSRTITVTASNGVGGSGSDSVTFDVEKGDPQITLTADKASVAANDTVRLTANNAPSGGTYAWTVDGAAAAETGKTLSYKATAEGTVNFAVTWSPTTNSDYNASNEATKTVTVTKMSPGLSVSATSNSASYGSGVITLTARASRVSGPDPSSFTWENSDDSVGELLSDSGQVVTFKPASSGTGTAQTVITCTYEDAAGNYETESKTVTITVSPTFEISPTSLSLRANNTSTQSFTVVTAENSTVTASSSNNNIATVEKTYTSSNSASHTFTVKPVAAGDATITVSYAGTTKTIKVHVASANPVISQVDFISCDQCTTNLNKYNNYGYLTITVKDYNPTNPYVTVTRSNIRSYISGSNSNSYSHPSTYSYVVTLTPTNGGLDGWAQLVVTPQYNGTTYYTASYTGASAKNSQTIYVTGHTTLPQTGPNYTWAYVLGGLCLATVATAVTLNVRKKKRESI